MNAMISSKCKSSLAIPFLTRKNIYQERALPGIAWTTNSSYEHFIEFPKALERWLYKSGSIIVARDLTVLHCQAKLIMNNKAQPI